MSEEASDRLGRWFARYGDDGAETFSARLLDGTDELGIAWTDDVTQLAGNIAAKHQDILEFEFENSNKPPSRVSEYQPYSSRIFTRLGVVVDRR